MKTDTRNYLLIWNGGQLFCWKTDHEILHCHGMKTDYECCNGVKTDQENFDHEIVRP